MRDELQKWELAGPWGTKIHEPNHKVDGGIVCISMRDGGLIRLTHNYITCKICLMVIG